MAAKDRKRERERGLQRVILAEEKGDFIEWTNTPCASLRSPLSLSPCRLVIKHLSNLISENSLLSPCRSAVERVSQMKTERKKDKGYRFRRGKTHEVEISRFDDPKKAYRYESPRGSITGRGWALIALVSVDISPQDGAETSHLSASICRMSFQARCNLRYANRRSQLPVTCISRA